ncbi:MAG: tetraacyldisaccharide 4'-kinase [Gammaproteobacteria bacterium]
MDEIWYGRSALAAALAPLAWLYGAAVYLRRHAYASGLAAMVEIPVPVVVVGNITAGGTGKTPLVVWIAHCLARHGYRPGVVCGGYRGQARAWPQQVRADSDPVMVGEEAVLLARHCAAPVAAARNRIDAALALLEHHGCDVLVCDDGLQHYRLSRDVEIAVVDGVRRFGNGRLLPAGPLREPPSRLRSVDMIVTNGIAGRGEFPMRYVPGGARSMFDPAREVALESFAPREVHAVAGIGHPERFFSMLRAAGLRVHKHPFADHHRFTAAQISFGDGLPVLMTEKDAIKCQRFADREHWYVPIAAMLPEVFEHRLLALLRGKDDGQEPA